MEDRIYMSEDGQWHYRLRGNQAAGPFASRAEAEQALNKQMRSWNGRAGPKSSWRKDWHPARVFRRSATRQT